MSITIKLPADLTTIDVNDLGELIWWSNHLEISPESLLLAINKVGSSVKEINIFISHNKVAAHS
ncbi:MAG: DUF3606 domain-containing protein [Ferruginibacter sp.]|nr:DUF3606 domain-containing protein [Ferruginibacter sp.]